MTSIQVSNHRARLFSDPKILDYVYQQFSVLDEKKQKIYKMRGFKYDAVRHFVGKPPHCFFPAGLASSVANLLRLSGEEVEVDDRTKFPEFRESEGILSLKFELWPEQRKLIDAFKLARRGTWHAATNSGKTECAGVLSHETGLTTLFLVNRKQLLLQTAQRFEDMLGEPIGYIGDSICRFGRVTVATVQTLHLALKGKVANSEEIVQWLTKEVELLIVDECHNAKATSYEKVVSRCSAKYRLAMSGTARTGDQISDLTLEGLFGPVIGTIANSEQTEKGRSSQLHVICVPVSEPSALRSLRGRERAEKLVYTNSIRNTLIAQACREAKEMGLGVVIATESKKLHVSALSRKLEKAGVNYERATGDESPEWRQAALKRLELGITDTVLATTVLNEGVDVPAVQVFIDAGASESSTRLLQQLGRALRRKVRGKDIAFFVLPIDLTHPKLEKIGNKKLDILEGEGCFTFHTAETPSDIRRIFECVTSSG